MTGKLKWYIDNVCSKRRVIYHGNANYDIVSDVSTLGWVGMCTDAAHHINYLDPLAGNLSVTAF
jgi:hypothetical protein